MSPKHISVIAIVSGTIFLVLIFNTISEVMAVILGAVAIAILVAGLVIERAYHRPDRFVEQLGEADILNRMWFPLQDELTDRRENGRPRDGIFIGLDRRSEALEKGDPNFVLQGNGAVRQTARARRFVCRERLGD